MLNPSVLCQTFSLFQEPIFDPDNPFNDSPPFDPDNPFGEEPTVPEEPIEPPSEVEEIPSATVTVLTRVRLSESSGDKATDAQGVETAQQAVLYFFLGVSRAGGSLEPPAIKVGDKLVEGIHSDLVFSDTSTVVADDEQTPADDSQTFAAFIESTTLRVWTVKGVKMLKSRSRDHHMEVSLV